MAAFDPKAQVRKINVAARDKDPVWVDYLHVAQRVLWARTAHPDLDVETTVAHLGDKLAIVRAVVVVPGGGRATGHGSAPISAPDAVEKAETTAIGRALEVLGYGTEAAMLGRTERPDVAPSEPAQERGNGAKPGQVPSDGRELAEQQGTGDGELAGPAADMMPADPAAAVAWFRRRVELMPTVDPVGEAEKATMAKALAVALREAGLSDAVRLAAYRALTGHDSGTAMDPRELRLLAELVTRWEVLMEIGLRQPVQIAAGRTRRAAR